MKTIWILGDSFSEAHRYQGFLKELIDNTQYKFVNYAMGSMDMQSVIDYWTKILHKIKKEDVLIVNVTEPSRFRVSLHSDMVENKSLNPYAMPKNSENTIQNKFHPLGIGYSNLIQSGWLSTLKRNSKSFHIEQFLPKESLIKFIKYLEVEYSSVFYIENQKELIKSLYYATNCDKKFIWSWDNIFDDEFIFTKDKMTKIIFNGNWETEHDVFINSNGLFGNRDDAHISPASNKILAEYIVNYLYL